MLEMAEFLHALTIAMTTGITAISVGIGQGIVGFSAVNAINIQPKAKDDIQKISLLGTAIIETSAIIGFAVAVILLLTTNNTNINIYSSIAELGIGIAISSTGLVIGLVSAMPAKNACMAAARQPFFGGKILKFMLITQSMIETPIIFSFIIAMLIKSMLTSVTTLEQSIKLLAAGLAIGLGSIGPALGLGQLGKTAFKAVGVNRKSYSKIFTFMLVNGAIIETPTIFALLISMLILGTGNLSMLKAISLLSAALCIGIGTFGPGISSGTIASSACTQIGINPDSYSLQSKTSIFAQSITETATIYALMVSLLIILI